MDRNAIGRDAEATAEKHLLKQGFKLVQRNFSARTGEIDLIMNQGPLLIFVEVRYRKSSDFGTGADTVTQAKQKKIIRTAQTFLQKTGMKWQQYRFDVVSISHGTEANIHWIPNAFNLD